MRLAWCVSLLRARVAAVPAEPEIPDEFKYQTVVAEVRRLIEGGMPRGSRLPTERTLAGRLGVSRLTVRKALDELERSGEVRRVHGSGTFVAGPTVEHGQSVRSFTQEMRDRGTVAHSEVLSVRHYPASGDIGFGLQVSPGEPLTELVRLRFANRVPMCLERAVLPDRRVPGLAEHDLSGSLYELLSSRYGIWVTSVRQEIRATAVSAEQAQLLSIPPHSPALSLSHVASDANGEPIEFADSLYRADRYTIHMELSSPRGPHPSTRS